LGIEWQLHELLVENNTSDKLAIAAAPFTAQSTTAHAPSPPSPSTMGLFDNPSSGAPASGTPAPKPLFGNASSTTTPSLFSQGASSTPVAPLFGTGAAKTMAPPFGATPASSQPGATSTPFSSLFQSTTAAQPTTTNPPLNTQQTSAGQPSAFPQSSLFSSSMAPPQQQADGPLSQSTANGTTRSAHFDHLLERGRKRNAAENAFGTFDELPSLQLGLGDIARKVRNLGAGGPSADQAQNSNA
jgi:nuclear pore complex protein Nup93